MKAFEIMEKLFSLSTDKRYEVTCDSKKAGDEQREVKKVAVSMFATIPVVKAAKEWGAELLVVHEPTYYNHMDEHSDEKIESLKRKYIEDSGLVIYRYHDYPHSAKTDMIADGMLKYMDFDGNVERTDVFDLVRIHLNKALTPRQIAKHLEEKLGIAHLRICGTADRPCKEISGMFGTPGGVFEELKREETEVLLTGEACEWALGEYARDANDLGFNKCLIIMGHIGSERDGMKLITDMINEKIEGIEAKYFECGEVYTYTDK